MKYYLDNKTKYIFPSFLKLIGKGIEGKVYKYKKYALKIYHNPVYYDSMDAETCVILKQLKTKRIILPQKMILDKNGDFKGYTTDFINNEQNIYDITREKLINELKELEKEIYYLVDNNILINDWNLDNLMYDGMMKLVDPGCYKYEIDKSRRMRKFGYFVLKDFLINELIEEGLLKESNNSIKICEELFKKCNIRYNIYMFIEKEMNQGETLGQYIKRIAKS